ncbi:NfeD family protein [Goodfellowiella coeruleoviolacea]|uniref:Membrane protein implicated in regulation of membrane protease activity n=1 Tax=Goodfellowiella coeruleoviolacea TaxID=334858 RepID=A0AAE3GHN5_9PSEU|nr:NfeD family protein [Goodfellowiella coeruleoviolacea]MCP2167562.1 Membrane protein implicated in regulation of membrane protease activity [Goodfellowiella coeruleoviolacea]
MAALLWLIAGVLLIAVEVLSGDFVLLMLGVGALAAAGITTLGADIVGSLVVFALASLGLITLARPALKRRLHAGEHYRSNTEALVGSRATVLSTVNNHGGQVRIGGEVWSARSYDETQVLQPGQSVTVMDIAGATALVWGEP